MGDGGSNRASLHRPRVRRREWIRVPLDRERACPVENLALALKQLKPFKLFFFSLGSGQHASVDAHTHMSGSQTCASLKSRLKRNREEEQGLGTRASLDGLGVSARIRVPPDREQICPFGGLMS